VGPTTFTSSIILIEAVLGRFNMSRYFVQVPSWHITYIQMVGPFSLTWTKHATLMIDSNNSHTLCASPAEVPTNVATTPDLHLFNP